MIAFEQAQSTEDQHANYNGLLLAQFNTPLPLFT